MKKTKPFEEYLKTRLTEEEIKEIEEEAKKEAEELTRINNIEDTIYKSLGYSPEREFPAFLKRGKVSAQRKSFIKHNNS